MEQEKINLTPINRKNYVLAIDCMQTVMKGTVLKDFEWSAIFIPEIVSTTDTGYRLIAECKAEGFKQPYSLYGNYFSARYLSEKENDKALFNGKVKLNATSKSEVFSINPQKVQLSINKIDFEAINTIYQAQKKREREKKEEKNTLLKSNTHNDDHISPQEKQTISSTSKRKASLDAKKLNNDHIEQAQIYLSFILQDNIFLDMIFLDKTRQKEISPYEIKDSAILPIKEFSFISNSFINPNFLIEFKIKKQPLSSENNNTTSYRIPVDSVRSLARLERESVREIRSQQEKKKLGNSGEKNEFSHLSNVSRPTQRVVSKYTSK